MIIHLISSPRTISTALMYSFDNREDCTGIDEPLYAHYLSNNNLPHPCRSEIIESQEKDPIKIFSEIDKMVSPYVFIKNMAVHLEGINQELYHNYYSLILLRDPKKIIASYAKVISDMTLDDLGIKQQYDIIQSLNKESKKYLVMDSTDILIDPSITLRCICEHIGMPFSSDMLSWTAGPRMIDGVWAKHWYRNIHTSTGFALYEESEVILTNAQREIYREALPYYQQLLSYRN